MVQIAKPLKFYGDKGHERTYAMTHKAFERHVIREEPVRAFRFHGNYIDKIYDKGMELIRPGFRVYRPLEKAKFSYNSTYAFSLTWTPGHMTLVGDLGEMTIVHYHAMPTLEAALSWLSTSDFDYLMKKTNIKQEFDREATIDHMWRVIMEGVEEHMKYLREEVEGWQKEKPKWLKSKGMKKAEYDQEIDYWKGDDPNINYNFRKVAQPTSIYLPRSLWTDDQKRGWSIPDGFEMLFKAWKFLDDEGKIHFDPTELFDAERQEQIKDELDGYFYESSNEEVVNWIVRDMDYDDYYGEYRYNDTYVWKMAAIQLGCQMIREQLDREKPPAPAEPEEAVVE